VKEAEETVIRNIIADKMDIKGGYAKPHWTDVLWVQLAILPLTAYRWASFYLGWLWRYGRGSLSPYCYICSQCSLYLLSV
jgi:DnaJ family protein C protein 25